MFDAACMSNPHSINSDEPPAEGERRVSGSRREFLTGNGAVRKIQRRVEAQLDASSNGGRAQWDGLRTGSGAGPDSFLEQYSKTAMACQFELIFNLHQYRQSSLATMQAFQLIDELEDQLTIYRDHSEVSRLNRLPAGQAMKIEAGLMDLLSLAKQLHRDTGGAFDVTAGPLSELWGFENRQGALPGEEQIATTLRKVNSALLKLEPSSCSATRLTEELKVNLGGIGKGYALDRVASLFRGRSVLDFAIHGGQSSVLAVGDSGADLQTVPACNAVDDASSVAPPWRGSGWKVGITHPAAAEVRLGEITLRNQALGTSGTARQGFFHKGKRYGHVIDPRTGWPTNHFLATTVVSPSAAVSDALATAFYVMPFDEVVEFCDQHPEVKAVLIESAGKNTSRVKATTLNFLDDEIQIFQR